TCALPISAAPFARRTWAPLNLGPVEPGTPRTQVSEPPRGSSGIEGREGAGNPSSGPRTKVGRAGSHHAPEGGAGLPAGENALARRRRRSAPGRALRGTYQRAWTCWRAAGGARRTELGAELTSGRERAGAPQEEERAGPSSARN